MKQMYLYLYNGNYITVNLVKDMFFIVLKNSQVFGILYFSVLAECSVSCSMSTSICINVLTEQPYLWSVHTWTTVAIPVHSMWVSNYIAGLCNALISSTCLIAVTVPGGPHAMTQPLVKKFSVRRERKLRNTSVKGPPSGSMRLMSLCGAP